MANDKSRGSDKGTPRGPSSFGRSWTTPASITKRMGGFLNPNARQIAADSTSYQPSGNQLGGYSGGGAVAPVSTLTGLPKSALLDTLIKNGLIKEGMPQEQALAILKFAQLREGTPIDVAELMKLVQGDYEKYTGDITTSGQDWMNQLMGTAYDPKDPNARMFADDPIFSDYAGGMAQMQETADTNLATDLAWFRKNQAAQEQYYNDMMTAISTGALPIGAAATGGGGGGGGSYGGGGHGGGGGGGDNGLGFGDSKTTVEGKTDSSFDTTITGYENYPGFRKDALEYAASFNDPVIYDNIESILNTVGSKPQDVLKALEEEQGTLDTANELYESVVGPGEMMGTNEAWLQAQPANVRNMVNEYLGLTGQVIGDNPATQGITEPFYLPEGAAPPILLPGSPESERAGALRTTLDPLLREASGGQLGNIMDQMSTEGKNAYLQQLAQNYVGSPEGQEYLAGTDWGGGVKGAPGQPSPTDIADFIDNAIQQEQEGSIPTPTNIGGGPSSVASQPSSSAPPTSIYGTAVSPQSTGTNVTPPIPNIPPSLPLGSEVPNTPETNQTYFEETGQFPWTPISDDPNSTGRTIAQGMSTPEAILGRMNRRPLGPTPAPAPGLAPNMGGQWPGHNPPTPDATWNPANQSQLEASIQDIFPRGTGAITADNYGGGPIPNAPELNPGATSLGGPNPWDTVPTPAAPPPNLPGGGMNPAYNDWLMQQAGVQPNQEYIGQGGGLQGQPNMEQILQILGQSPTLEAANMGGQWPGHPSGQVGESVAQVPLMMQAIAKLTGRTQGDQPPIPLPDVAGAISNAVPSSQLSSLVNSIQTGSTPTGPKPKDPEMLRIMAEGGKLLGDFNNLVQGWTGETQGLNNIRQEQYDRWGYDPEAAAAASVPDTTELINRIILDPNGQLNETAQRIMQNASMRQLQADYPEFTGEERARVAQGGEYYNQPEISEEEYQRNLKYADIIPWVQEYGVNPYNPDVGPAVVYNKATQSAGESQSAKTTGISWEDPAAVAGPLGMPVAQMPEEDINPIDRYNPEGGMGDFGSGMGSLHTEGVNISDLLRRNAANMLQLPATVEKAVAAPTYTGGGKKGYRSTSAKASPTVVWKKSNWNQGKKATKNDKSRY